MTSASDNRNENLSTFGALLSPAIDSFALRTANSQRESVHLLTLAWDTVAREILVHLKNALIALLAGGGLTLIPYLPRLTSMPDPFGERFERVFSFLEFPGFLVAYLGGHPPHDLSERLMTVSNFVIWSSTGLALLRLRKRRRQRAPE